MATSRAPTFRGLPVRARFYIPAVLALAAGGVAAAMVIDAGPGLDPTLLGIALILCAITELVAAEPRRHAAVAGGAGGDNLGDGADDLIAGEMPVWNWSAQLVDGAGTVQTRGDADVVGGEAALDKVLASAITTVADAGLAPNNLIDPSTGQIDYSRASWSRASWSRASWSATPQTCTDLERASWSRASWSRASWSRASWSGDLTSEQIAEVDRDIAAAKEECSHLLANIDPSRASLSRASWSRASWSTSFDK